MPVTSWLLTCLPRNPIVNVTGDPAFPRILSRSQGFGSLGKAPWTRSFIYPGYHRDSYFPRGCTPFLVGDSSISLGPWRILRRPSPQVSHTTMPLPPPKEITWRGSHSVPSPLRGTRSCPLLLSEAPSLPSPLGI